MVGLMVSGCALSDADRMKEADQAARAALVAIGGGDTAAARARIAGGTLADPRFAATAQAVGTVMSKSQGLELIAAEAIDEAGRPLTRRLVYRVSSEGRQFVIDVWVDFVDGRHTVETLSMRTATESPSVQQ